MEGDGGRERTPLTTQDGRARTDRRGLPLEGIDGNWKCEQCGNVNFGSRDKCNRCQTMKGGGMSGSGGMGGGMGSGMAGNVKEMALKLVSVRSFGLPSGYAHQSVGACSHRVRGTP